MIVQGSCRSERNEALTIRCGSPYGMRASALIPKLWTDCFKLFIPPRTTAWESDFPSAVPSSSAIMAAFGRSRTTDRAPLFHFPFLRGREVHRMRDEEPSMVRSSLVSVVDDDESVRES